MSDKEYNLNNPTVAEEERMIQDCINEKYEKDRIEQELYWIQMEKDYEKSLEESYLKSVEAEL